jgi:protein PhnA
MSTVDFKEELLERSEARCELCEEPTNLNVIEVTSLDKEQSADTSALLCPICSVGIHDPKGVSSHHWKCLHGAIWSAFPVIQVISWRVLQQLKEEGWAQDLLGQMYLEDEILLWAEHDGAQTPTLDSNGIPLKDGDSVFLIKDLDVKGASFVAKRGTTVRNIRLSSDLDYIEGRVKGSKIMLKTCFIKKV